MLKLYLLRHGKSAWDDPDIGDHARPLSQRGVADGPRMGRYMAQHGLKPDCVLSSDSVRTRETVALVLPELGTPEPRVEYDPELYLASAYGIAERLRAGAGEASCVMIVGHNPGMHALALALAGEGCSKGMQHLAVKYPTAALAVFEFDTDDWGEVSPGKGVLKAFVRPRDLAA